MPVKWRVPPLREKSGAGTKSIFPLWFREWHQFIETGANLVTVEYLDFGDMLIDEINNQIALFRIQIECPTGSAQYADCWSRPNIHRGTEIVAASASVSNLQPQDL
jgi:hypothetical protein